MELLGLTSIGLRMFTGTGITSLTFGEKVSSVMAADSQINHEFTSTCTKVTFKNQYFDRMALLLRDINANSNPVTVYYPAGKGWPKSFGYYRMDNLTLIAYGEADVTFVCPDGTKTVKKVTVGKTATPPTDIKLQNGEEIIGWYTDNVLDSKYKWDFSKPVTEDMTLYAKTNKSKVCVYYNYPKNAGDINNPDKYAYKHLEEVTYGDKAPFYKINISGTKLLGWYTNKELTKAFDFNTPINDTLTLYSKWEKVDIIDIGTSPDIICTREESRVYLIGDMWYRPSVKLKSGNEVIELVKGDDYTVNYGTYHNPGYMEHVGDYHFIITGKGNYTGTIDIYVHVVPLDFSSSYAKFSLGDAEFTYNGQVQKCSTSLRIACNNTYYYLDDENYEVSFPDKGKNAYVDAGQYTVLVKAKGKDCVGEVKIIETIEPIDVYSLAYDEKVSYQYNQKVQKYKPTVVASLRQNSTYKKVTLTENKDYTLEYVDENKAGAFKEPGTYTIMLKCIGNYTGEDTITETIRDDKPISSVTVTGVKNVTYNGNAQRMTKLVVKYKGKLLEEGTHYTVSYKNNKNAGTATIVIEGNDNYGFYGTKSVTFKIAPLPISKATVAGIDKGLTKTYTGSDIELSGVSLGYNVSGNAKTLKGYGASAYVQLGNSAKTRYDYTYEYKNNLNVGTAKVIFKGVNNYSGSITKTFKIATAAFTEDAVAAGSVKVELPSSAVYTKGKTTPEPVVYYLPGKANGGNNSSEKLQLVKGKDYKLVYSNNTVVYDKSNPMSNPKKVPTVKIVGLKNFKGTITRTFDIKPSSITNCTATAKNVKYKKAKGNFKSAVTVKDSNGVKLVANKDYDAKNMTYVDASTGKELVSTDIVPIGTKVKVVIKGLGNYESNKTISCTYSVVK